MYKLKVSGYILMCLLLVPNVALAGRTGYIAPNPLMDVCQLLISAVFVYISLKFILKSFNPKEDMDFRGRISTFALATVFGLFWFFLMSVSSDALGITNIHLLRYIF